MGFSSFKDTNITRAIVTVFKVRKIYHYSVKVYMFMIDLMTLSVSLRKLAISE